MKIKKKLANVFNWCKGVFKKWYIVIHYSAGDKDTADNNTTYFAREKTGTSANVFIDDNGDRMSVPLDATAYHCGVDYSGGKAPYWGKCTNKNSIGIEMCGIAKDKILDLRNKTIKNTVEYTRRLMKKYKIKVKNVIRHFDVCGKNCPAPFVKNPLAWDCFKLNLQTPFTVKTTKDRVGLYDKLGGKVVKCWKKGKKLTITAVYLEDGELYGKGKSTKKYQKLKNTTYKKYL